jgi:hypothetical protein
MPSQNGAARRRLNEPAASEQPAALASASRLRNSPPLATPKPISVSRPYPSVDRMRPAATWKRNGSARRRCRSGGGGARWRSPRAIMPRWRNEPGPGRQPHLLATIVFPLAHGAGDLGVEQRSGAAGGDRRPAGRPTTAIRSAIRFFPVTATSRRGRCLAGGQAAGRRERLPAHRRSASPISVTTPLLRAGRRVVVDGS